MLRHLCPLCGAAMASINISSGGYLEFCSRRGCRGHALGGFGDIDQMMSLVNRMLKTPHD
jgi:Zn-finger nucleic acid-binding protein